MRPLYIAFLLTTATNLSIAPASAVPADRLDADPAIRREPSSAPLAPGAKESEPKKAYRVERFLESSRTEVNAADAVDELIDELAADLARIGAVQVSPILIDRIQLSTNIAAEFAPLFETRLTSALQRATHVSISKCLECRATRGRVENSAWVLTRGATQLDELKQWAANYGAKTVLSVALSLRDDGSAIALDAELLRPENAAVIFSEGYRFNADDTLLYRSADRAQYREQRLRDLQDRLEGRPHYGYGLQMGVMYVPIKPDGGERELVRGLSGGVRFFEQFGDQRQFNAGFQIGGFLNDTKLAGAMLSTGVLWRVTAESGYRPALSVGSMVGAFITGTAGNSFYGSLLLEVRFLHRIGLQASVTYLDLFNVKKQGLIGGWSPGGGLVVSW